MAEHERRTDDGGADDGAFAALRAETGARAPRPELVARLEAVVRAEGGRFAFHASLWRSARRWLVGGAVLAAVLVVVVAALERRLAADRARSDLGRASAPLEVTP